MPPLPLKRRELKLLVDQTEAAGDTVAQFLGIPFITVCCALAINRETTSPFFTPWGYQNAWWARIRNQVAYYLLDRNKPISKSSISIASGSCRFTTASVFPVLDLPKSANSLPILIFPVRFARVLHYTGPLRNSEPLSVPFERLTGQPL